MGSGPLLYHKSYGKDPKKNHKGIKISVFNLTTMSSSENTMLNGAHCYKPFHISTGIG